MEFSPYYYVLYSVEYRIKINCT